MMADPRLGTEVNGAPRALVFGASGYIGSNLVPHLVACGYRVRAAGRNREVLEARDWQNVELVQADALRPETLGVALQGIDVAYPYAVLSEVRVVNDVQGEQDLVVFFTPGTASALGAQVVANAEDVGATGVFDPNLDGQKLTFGADGDTIVDEQTGRTWNILGQAIEGPLAGEELDEIIHGDHFWFSWAAFKPDTIIFQN